MIFRRDDYFFNNLRINLLPCKLNLLFGKHICKIQMCRPNVDKI